MPLSQLRAGHRGGVQVILLGHYFVLRDNNVCCVEEKF